MQQAALIQVTQEMVPMRDGIRLATSIHHPAGEGPWPTVLFRTGYGKDEPYSGLDQMGRRAAELGFAYVAQDVRGRYGSEGDYELALNDRTDAYDTVDWLVAQPWSNGAVALGGSSYLGLTALLGMVGNHPAVKAVASSLAGGIFDGFGYYAPGVAQIDVLVIWPLASILQDALRRSGAAVTDPVVLKLIEFPLRDVAAELMAATPPTPERLAELVSQIQTLMAEQVETVGRIYQRPPHEVIQLLAEHIPWVKEWASHPDPGDSYWLSRDISSGMEDVTAPALYATGWHDLFIRGAIRTYLRVQANPNSGPQKLVISPYSHYGTMFPVSEWTPQDVMTPDAMEIGSVSYAPNSVMTRWYERFLKGHDNGIDTEAPISIYVQRANVWRDEWEWPLARTEWTRLHLRGGGAANTAAGDGRLSATPPGDEPPDSYSYDPKDPVPTRGGTTLGTGSPAGITDQSDVETRRDVLVYTGDPVESGVEVTGPVTVELWVTTSAVDTDFTAKLTDLAPDGRSTNVCDGVTRLRYRPEAPGLVTPGEVQRITIELTPTSYLFLPGHAFRLQISSSNYPLQDVNLNTGESSLLGDSSVIARQTVLHDDRHPSVLVLPVIPT
ncbi:CocE/NonD family hydrolase [Streptomyces sp. NBC_00075]|uniref:CocE/NonD family hydrolase n=1 Tax=Streptomyces sp. NBC_00075 TaxID=2975641 RepID=UPI00324D628A